MNRRRERAGERGGMREIEGEEESEVIQRAIEKHKHRIQKKPRTRERPWEIEERERER